MPRIEDGACLRPAAADAVTLQAADAVTLQAAEAADAAEDKAFGADRRGDEMPDWVADKQARLAKIHQAKAELEAEAKAKAAAELPARAKVDEKPPRNAHAGPGQPGARPARDTSLQGIQSKSMRVSSRSRELYRNLSKRRRRLPIGPSKYRRSKRKEESDG
jgi:hypothetical protein